MLTDNGNDVDAKLWNSVVSENDIQLRYEYLHILEQNLSNDFKFYYLQVFYKTEVIANTIFFIDENFSFQSAMNGIYSILYKVVSPKFKILFLSSPITEYNKINIKAEYQIYENEIVNIILQKVDRFSREKKLDAVLMRDHFKKYESDYLRDNYSYFYFMPGTIIHFECECFDDYILKLNKKRRKNIRSKLRKCDGRLRIHIRDASELSDRENARCFELYLQTFCKNKTKHEKLSESYFKSCGEVYKKECKMIIAKVDDIIVGFAQLLETKKDVINVRMGMDYSFVREYNLYYHLLYANINYCIENLKHHLYISQTCYRPKLEVGADLVSLHCYIRFNNRILNRILPRFLNKNFKCYRELIVSDNPREILEKYHLSKY